jgi:hypothetical protein
VDEDLRDRVLLRGEAGESEKKDLKDPQSMYCGHRNLDLSRTRMLKKRANFFRLVSTLFFEVKRGFVEPCKTVPM